MPPDVPQTDVLIMQTDNINRSDVENANSMLRVATLAISKEVYRKLWLKNSGNLGFGIMSTELTGDSPSSAWFPQVTLQTIQIHSRWLWMCQQHQQAGTRALTTNQWLRDAAKREHKPKYEQFLGELLVQDPAVIKRGKGKSMKILKSIIIFGWFSRLWMILSFIIIYIYIIDPWKKLYLYLK